MLDVFLESIEELNRQSEKPKRWVLVNYDQLNDLTGPLASDKSKELGILMIESHSYFNRRPYHKQKLALSITNMRNFALEQARLGRFVEYMVTDSSFRETVLSFHNRQSLSMMEPAEYETRSELDGVIEFVPNESWLTSIEDLEDSQKGGPPWRMDQFYRHVRKNSGILMEDGKPLGGKYSFDSENREVWKGSPAAPEFPAFQCDAIKEEVQKLIETKFLAHPGALDMMSIPATREDVDLLWRWVKDNCMENFGAFEDAMSTDSKGLFHSRASALINIGRLLPKQLIADVLDLDIPLNSKEGFIRQVIGWREFVRLIHQATKGFRVVDGQEISVDRTPGDGGYKSWAAEEFPQDIPSNIEDRIDGGATPSHFGADNPLPRAYWGEASGLNCLDTVVESVWSEAYSHHITRLMILSNIATLLDLSPRELTDWFWIAYSDAYDWVVEPNVIGMGTHAAGEIMTTKPYISGANYINKMSDYCQGCKFDPKKNCPLTRLYWAFLNRHKEKLEGNFRLRMPLNSLKKRSEDDKELDIETFKWVSETLKEGESLEPENLPESGNPDC